MFYPDDKQYSNAEEKAYAREDLVYNVTEDILILLEDMDVSKKELAHRLGKSKSYVSQVLSGARNMTLGSLSDICFVLNVKPQIVLPIQEAKVEEKVEHWKLELTECKAEAESGLKLHTQKIIEFPRSHSRWNRKVA